MGNFNIPSGLLISVILALATFGFITTKMGGKAEKAMHDVGTNIGVVKGLIAGLVVFNLCALAIGFPVPNWLVWAWPLLHGPFDTVRDILFGEIDNNGITLFEMKRIFWLLVVCFIILFILFRSHLWTLLFFLAIFGIVIISMAESREITPLLGEVATTTAYSFPGEGKSIIFFEKTIYFFKKNYQVLGFIMVFLLVGGFYIKKTNKQTIINDIRFFVFISFIVGILFVFLYKGIQSYYNGGHPVRNFLVVISAILALMMVYRPGEEEEGDDT